MFTKSLDYNFKVSMRTQDLIFKLARLQENGFEFFTGDLFATLDREQIQKLVSNLSHDLVEEDEDYDEDDVDYDEDDVDATKDIINKALIFN